MTSCKENKSILSFSLHCSAVALQLWINISHNLYMKAVRLSSPYSLQFISMTGCGYFENSAHIFSLREYYENL